MSEFERGFWVTLAGVTAILALILLITGSDEWIDGVGTASLMAYIAIAIVGKRNQQKRGLT